MQARLLCRTGELSGTTHALSPETVIGRDGTDVVIASNLISGRHARIRQDGKGFVLEDLGSENGTWLDGERVVQPVRLDRLNVITLARTYDFIFQADAPASVASPSAKAKPTPVVSPPVVAAPVAPPVAPPVARPVAPPAPTPVAPPVAPPAAPKAAAAQETQFFDDAFGALPTLQSPEDTARTPALGESTIEVGGLTQGMMALPPNLDASGAGDSTMHMDFGAMDMPTLDAATPADGPALYRLVISGTGRPEASIDLSQRRRYTVGRAMECDISLDEEQVSRHHATLTVGDTVTIEDAGSSNGTHVNGRRILAATEIPPGSSFTLGLSITVTLVRT